MCPRRWRPDVPGLLYVLRLLVLAGLALGSAGCARIFSSYDVAPNGMPRRDDTLRRLLVAGRADSAQARVEPKGESAPDDELLRSLYGGILAHYSGDYESSSAALEQAVELAEDRYTKRISRAALSVITSDKVLPYEPGDSERLLIHYYAALNYLRQEDLVGAAVEARRLSSLLERAESPRDSTLHGWLRYFSGVVFEAAGERNDAAVAYRNARALLGDRAAPGRSGGQGLESLDAELPIVASRNSGPGEVVVLVEEGFVAHRVEQALVVPLYSFELDRLSGGESGSRLSAAASISTRVLAHALTSAAGDPSYGGTPIYYGSRPRTLRVAPLPADVVRRECAAADTIATKGSGRPTQEKGRPDNSRQPDPAPLATPSTVTGGAGGLREVGPPPPSRSASPRATPRGTPRAGSRAAPRACADMRNPYLLRIAWPVFRQERALGSSWRVIAESGDSRVAAEEEPPLRTWISGAVARDFEAERGAILARTILRGVTKAAVTRGIEKAPGEDAAELGRLLGALVNLSTALLEQADIRSWQLLPDQIGLVRLQLPPGEHDLAVEVLGAGGGTRRVELGRVVVRPGTLSFRSARIWN